MAAQEQKDDPLLTWCEENNYQAFYKVLKEDWEFNSPEEIADLFYHSPEDFNPLFDELKLQRGKNARFIKAVKNISPQVAPLPTTNPTDSSTGNSPDLPEENKEEEAVFLHVCFNTPHNTRPPLSFSLPPRDPGLLDPSASPAFPTNHNTPLRTPLSTPQVTWVGSELEISAKKERVRFGE